LYRASVHQLITLYPQQETSPNTNSIKTPALLLPAYHRSLARFYLSSYILFAKLYDIGQQQPFIETLYNMPFTTLGLSDPLLRAIADAGYVTPSPIQSQAIPAV
jgi:Superfamily II DNA and RNA helicases